MPNSPYTGLSDQLRQSGVQDYWAARLASEIDDHYDDIVESAIAEGESGPQARAIALRELGNCETLVEHAIKRRSILATRVRLSILFGAEPQVVTCSGLFEAGGRKAYLQRLSAAAFAGATFTASLLFILHTSIHLN